jgi:hypothetical protein
MEQAIHGNYVVPTCQMGGVYTLEADEDLVSILETGLHFFSFSSINVSPHQQFAYLTIDYIIKSWECPKQILLIWLFGHCA